MVKEMSLKQAALEFPLLMELPDWMLSDDNYICRISFDGTDCKLEIGHVLDPEWKLH